MGKCDSSLLAMMKRGGCRPRVRPPCVWLRDVPSSPTVNDILEGVVVSPSGVVGPIVPIHPGAHNVDKVGVGIGANGRGAIVLSKHDFGDPHREIDYRIVE